MSNSLQPRELLPTRLLSPWDCPGENTRVGCHFLLQGIFLTQGLNLDLLNCRQILYRLSHQETDLLRKFMSSIRGETLGTFLLKSGTRPGCPLSLLYYLILYQSCYSKHLEKKNYVYENGKRWGQMIFTYKSYDCVSGKTKDQLKNYYNQEDNSLIIKLIQPL